MARKFTAIYKKSGKWYLGFIEEIPGVNTQGKTLKETKENLKEALLLVIDNFLAKKICRDLGIAPPKRTARF